jgi:hypothetical protein
MANEVLNESTSLFAFPKNSVQSIFSRITTFFWVSNSRRIRKPKDPTRCFGSLVKNRRLICRIVFEFLSPKGSGFFIDQCFFFAKKIARSIVEASCSEIMGSGDVGCFPR